MIAAGNIGCMMQIGSGTAVPVVHTAELLDWATGRAAAAGARGGLRARSRASRSRLASVGLAVGRRWRAGARRAPAVAQERRMLDAEEAVAFRGVGRLNVAGTRFCTATLISETVIVTAAHCLFHPRTRARVPLAEFRFVAGLPHGQDGGGAAVARAVTQPDFTFEGFASPAGVVADLALLELADAGARRRTRRPSRPGDLGAGRRPARHRLLRPRPGAGALDRGALRRRRQPSPGWRRSTAR